MDKTRTNNIFRHKPGLISKSTLPSYNVEEETRIDPLSGNYTLLKQESIVIGLKSEFRNLEIHSFQNSVDDNKKVKVESKKALLLSDLVTNSESNISSADFLNTGKEFLSVCYNA